LLKDISHKLSCIGIPLHGISADEHDSLTGVKGNFDKTVNNIKYYVAHGYDVRCVIVLTGYNYNKMYNMIQFAANLGMESVYIDRYEDGGLGATISGCTKLKPTLEQFRVAVRQILDARDNLDIFKKRIGFGTAIPMCIDERLILENMTSTCGVGSSFCAINPDGFLRICNQSEIKFGNILDEPIENLWSKKELNIYRDFSWVIEPCKSCKLLEVCQCGCKVDINYSDKFCIDFAIRENIDRETSATIKKINNGIYDDYIYGSKETNLSFSSRYKIFKLNKYLKIHEKYADKKLVTRYHTITIDNTSLQIINSIIDENIVNEKDVIKKYHHIIDIDDIRTFITSLINIGALDIIGEVI
jgi:radical SAM protein with 4Fe4S-binding SPASM domain